MLANGGHIGMVTDLVPYADQVAEYLLEHAGQDFPGVFEYEVTEDLGAWLANNTSYDSSAWTVTNRPLPILFAAELASKGDAFFSQ
jgi:hypothetical protein